jgi:hypothetical protein
MDISPALLWQIVVTIAIGPLAYFLRDAHGRLREIEVCISRTRESLAREYATKQDLHADVGRVLDRLDKLDDKLDRLLTAERRG